MRNRAAVIEVEPALIEGASYSLHVGSSVRPAFSTATIVASSPAREDGIRMRERLRSGSHRIPFTRAVVCQTIRSTAPLHSRAKFTDDFRPNHDET